MVLFGKKITRLFKRPASTSVARSVKLISQFNFIKLHKVYLRLLMHLFLKLFFKAKVCPKQFYFSLILFLFTTLYAFKLNYFKMQKLLVSLFWQGIITSQYFFTCDNSLQVFCIVDVLKIMDRTQNIQRSRTFWTKVLPQCKQTIKGIYPNILDSLEICLL